MSELDVLKTDDKSLFTPRSTPRRSVPVGGFDDEAPTSSSSSSSSSRSDPTGWGRRGYVPAYDPAIKAPKRSTLLDPFRAVPNTPRPANFAVNPNLSRSDAVIADMFDEPDTTHLFPSRMRANNPYVNERHIGLKNLPTLSEPSITEFGQAAVANDFRRPSWAHNAKILGALQQPRGDAAPLSRAQRQQLAALRKNQQLANQAAFWRQPGAAAMHAAQKKVRDWRSLQKEQARRNRVYMDRTTGNLALTDPTYLQKEAALKNLARYLPGTITKPEYQTDLKNLRGRYVTDPRYTQLGFNPALAGTAWRSLDPNLRKQKMAQFAELIGMFNLKPRRDERLTTVASASTVYNTADYDIVLEDLDNNPGTPGMVVITTKNNQTDRNGNIIPAGTIVAVDGWVV